jgi:hypothetical protein
VKKRRYNLRHAVGSLDENIQSPEFQQRAPEGIEGERKAGPYTLFLAVLAVGWIL